MKTCIHLNTRNVVKQFLWKREGVCRRPLGLASKPRNNSETFRELIQNNTTYFLLSEFVSNNTDTFREIIPNKIHFLSEFT